MAISNHNLSASHQSPQAFQKKQKPQIISIPGAPIKEKYRYRVTLGGEILGDRLSLEQAAELAGLKVQGVKA